MRFAQVNENIVVGIVTLIDPDQISEMAKLYQNIIELDNLYSVQVGWLFDGKRLSPPANTSPANIVLNTILMPAKKFGEDLINQFVAENILMGITQAGKTEVVGEALKDLSFWITQGSLYVALVELERLKVAMDPTWAPYITYDILNAFENKIKSYLGII